MNNATIQEMLAKSTDKELAKLLNTPFAPFAQQELDFRIANADARKKEIQENGTTILGIQVTYTDLLHLATITNKKWYEMPEGNIVERLTSEVARALEGVQSREANALKEAIAQAK